MAGTATLGGLAERRWLRKGGERRASSSGLSLLVVTASVACTPDEEVIDKRLNVLRAERLALVRGARSITRSAA
jgi:hypothetical protein